MIDVAKLRERRRHRACVRRLVAARRSSPPAWTRPARSAAAATRRSRAAARTSRRGLSAARARDAGEVEAPHAAAPRRERGHLQNQRPVRRALDISWLGGSEMLARLGILQPLLDRSASSPPPPPDRRPPRGVSGANASHGVPASSALPARVRAARQDQRAHASISSGVRSPGVLPVHQSPVEAVGERVRGAVDAPCEMAACAR